MLPVASYTFTIPAGGSFPLQCTGRYFRVNSATGSLKVEGQGSFGPMGAVGVGQGLRLRPVDQPFQRLSFVDTSGSPNIVTVIIADADFVDNTVLGSVSVIDGEKARTLAGGMFAGAPVVGALAGNYGSVQLWNPAGTAKNLIVTQLDVIAIGAPGNPIIAANAAALTTAYAAGVANKKLGGGAGVGQLRTDQTVGVPATVGTLKNVQTSNTANFPWPIKGAIVVPPGFGLLIFNNTIAQGVGANLEWFEEPQ